MVVDLVIKNGKVVTPKGIFETGIAIDNGIIVALSKTSLPSGEHIIDARNLIILPGIIDGHAHLTCHPENSITGTRAAAKGGVTTVMDMPDPEFKGFTKDQIDAKRKEYEKTSYVDFCIHGGSASGYPEGTISEMCKSGVTGIKFFLTSMSSFWPIIYDGEIIDKFNEISKESGLSLIHAENDHIIQYNMEKLRRSGRRDYSAHLDWRPPLAEKEAANRMILYLKETGCRGLFVHTSLPEVVYDVMRAKNNGVEAYTETCPQYLFLNENHVKEKGPWAKFAPPARSIESVNRLWKLLSEGRIDTIASDHSPFSGQEKNEGIDDIFRAPNGIPGLETMLPLLLTAVNRGRISLQTLTKTMAENPARIFGIFPKKGIIQVGSDADLVLCDMKKENKIENAELETACGWSPFESFKTIGQPTHTIVRGNLVMEKSEIVGKSGLGNFITREKSQIQLSF